MTHKLPVVWRQKAADAVADIVAYIGADNPNAARNLQMRIRTAADTIVEHPLLYRAGRVAGTREMVVHPNYIVIYRIERAAIEIVDVIHARRNYP